MLQPGIAAKTDNVQRAIEHRIMERTWGRIHGLRVKLDDGRIVVKGNSSTYHTKQLALEAALEWLGPTEAHTVEIDIAVMPPDARQVVGREWK